MSKDIIPFGWRSRAEPLVPAAAAAVGEAAVRILAARLLARDDAELARIHGVVASDRSVIVILAEPALLPWFDGVLYLGRDPRAPSLLVPTPLEPDVPIELVERALLRRVREAGPPSLRGPQSSHHATPLAVLLDVPAVVPCGPALPLARSRLAEAGRAA
jgi:hypothetical protein